MKTYSKPNTEIYNVELQNMIADSPGPTIKTEEITSNNDVLGKETEISSTSLWDEEE